MNRLLIEPGIKPKTWSHHHYQGFKHVQTEDHPSPELTISDQLWLSLNQTYDLKTNPKRTNSTNPPHILRVESPKPSPGLPLARTEWYTPSEVQEISRERAARRE